MQRGEKIGRFVLQSYLGRGGMGDVWLADDTERGFPVALKLIRRQFTDREALESEQRGAALQQELHRFVPEVAEVYDFAQIEEFFAIAMEYVDGSELSVLLQDGALDEPEAIAISLQICRILENLQAASARITGARGGVVHGDVKPENIRLQKGNRVRLLDFGVAKSLSTSRNFTRNVFGSVAYLSPERLAEGVVTLQSDLWAVGVVLYQMVTGRLPFVGETLEALESRILSRQPPERPSCSLGLQKVLLRSLAADPRQRYQTPAELRADLEAVQAGKPLASWGRSGSAAPGETRRTASLFSVVTHHASPIHRSPGTVRVRARDPEADDATPVHPSPPRPLRRLVLLIACVLLLVFGGSQVFVQVGLGQIQRELASVAAADVESLWSRYQRLNRWRLLGGSGAAAAMKEALERAVYPTLTGYSGDDSRSRKENWERAARHLAAILEIAPDDSASRARLAYCRGHLALAALKELKERGEEDEALRLRQDEAIAEFRQATELDGSWAPPYLSLARIYAYHRLDLAQLQEVLNRAAQRDAERRLVTALLADGHLAEGRNLYRQSLGVRGSRREPELLRAAVSHFGQAEALYAEIPGYAQTERNRAEAERRRTTAENRLAILEGW